MRRQHGVDGTPRELAVADLPSARASHPAGLAHRKWRKIIVEKECLLVRTLKRVDPLLILTCAERRHDQRLRLAAGEQSRAVGARQHADL